MSTVLEKLKGKEVSVMYGPACSYEDWLLYHSTTTGILEDYDVKNGGIILKSRDGKRRIAFNWNYVLRIEEKMINNLYFQTLTVNLFRK